MKISDLQIQQNAQQIRPGGVQTGKLRHTPKSNIEGSHQKSFQDVLNERIGRDNSLRFSSHAAKRISERNIELTSIHMSRLGEGLSRVKEKGSQSSLLLMDEMAYVISVKNQTVVTALNKETTRSNVFTNIDSVAIV